MSFTEGTQTHLEQPKENNLGLDTLQRLGVLWADACGLKRSPVTPPSLANLDFLLRALLPQRID